MGVSRVLLWGSTYGEPILVNTTSTTGVTVHQGSSSTQTGIDSIYLYGVNTGSVTHQIYLQILNSTIPIVGAVYPAATDPPTLLLDGNVLKSNSTSIENIVAYGSTSAGLAVYGYANRITT